MQGIQFKQRFTGSTRLVPDVNLVDDIKAESVGNRRGWYTADERGVALLRRQYITLFSDRHERNGGSDTFNLKTGKTGAILTTDPDIPYTCAQFDDAAYDHAATFQYGTSGGFSFACVFKATETGNNQNIFNAGISGSGGVGGITLYKAANASNLIYNYNGTVMTIPISIDTWQFVWITHTGSGLRAWLNGVMRPDVTASLFSNSAAATIGASSGGGGPFKGKLADVWIYNFNIHALMGNAGMEQFNAYVRTYYGINVAVLS